MSPDRRDDEDGRREDRTRGAHVVVDGEELTVEDTVMAAVCDGRLSPDLLDHGFDTYWCVTEDGHHRLLRASELCLASADDQRSSRSGTERVWLPPPRPRMVAPWRRAT